MKRIASAILLLLFLYNIIGYYASYSVLQWENSSQMNLSLKTTDHLQTLRVHRSELKSIVFNNDEKEMTYKGEIYDTKNISVDGDYIVFHCLKDNKEKTLLDDLNLNVGNNIDTKSSGKDSPEKSGQQNIIKDYFISAEGITFYNHSQAALFKSPPVLFSTFVVSLSVPPPQQS